MSANSKFDEMFNDVKTKEEFCEWAWKETAGGIININKLAETLNTSMHRKHNYVRIEKYRPHIYGVALKHKYDQNWQFVKIGYTHVDTSVGNSRMTKIEDNINKVYGDDKGKTMFVLAIDPLETKSFTEVEKTYRQKMGIPVQKKLAKKLCLPVPTEWVMTTTAFSKKFVDDIKRVVDKRNVHTGVMQNKFEKRINLPLHLNPPQNINNGETVQICFINEEICFKDSISCSSEASGKPAKKQTNQGGESSLEKESDTSDSTEASVKQTKKETKQGESFLKKESDSSDNPEASVKQTKKETNRGESSKESDTSDSPETSGKQRKKETKHWESSLKKESDTSDSPEASGKQAKALKETKAGEPSLKKSGPSKSPGTTGQQTKASKSIGKDEKPKK